MCMAKQFNAHCNEYRNATSPGFNTSPRRFWVGGECHATCDTYNAYHRQHMIHIAQIEPIPQAHPLRNMYVTDTTNS